MPRMSFEGVVGTVLALLTVILDQAGLRNPFILWIAFSAAIAFCTVATIRSRLKKIKKALVLTAILISFGTFGYKLYGHSVSSGQQSLLEVTNILGVRAQNKNTQRKGFYFNVFYDNKGTIAAAGMVHRSIILPSDHLLSSEEVESYEKQAASIPQGQSAPVEEIQPGIPPGHYFTTPDSDSGVEQLGAVADEALAGRKRIYLFVVLKYQDVGTSSAWIRETDFCGWFLDTFEVWHNCGSRIHSLP